MVGGGKGSKKEKRCIMRFEKGENNISVTQTSTHQCPALQLFGRIGWD